MELTALYPMAADFGDFDHDGYLDVAIVSLRCHPEEPSGTCQETTLGGRILVLRNKEGQLTQVRLPWSTPPGPGEITIADIDGDGELDIITTHLEADLVAIRRKMEGEINFHREERLFVEKPSAAAVSDLDGDGLSDLVVASLIGDKVVVLYQPFSEGRSHEWYLGNAPLALALADVNLDGNLDIVVANTDWQRSVSVVLADDLVTSFPLGRTAKGLDVCQLDGEFLDIVTVDVAKDDVFLILNLERTVAVPARVVDPFKIACTDLDNDGRDDLVILGQKGISLLKNASHDGFYEFIQIDYFETEELMRDLLVFDVNHNEKLDIIAVGGENKVKIWLQD